MKLNAFMAIFGVVALLSGCVQQEEVAMVKPQPTFDKFGNGSCEDGLIYVPGSTVVDPCIPEDECEPVYDSAGNIIDCLPPFEVQEDGDRPSGGRSPTGSTAGTP